MLYGLSLSFNGDYCFSFKYLRRVTCDTSVRSTFLLQKRKSILPPHILTHHVRIQLPSASTDHFFHRVAMKKQVLACCLLLVLFQSTAFGFVPQHNRRTITFVTKQAAATELHAAPAMVVY
jgi:hypothetical protein